jgi:hypothetical protein
LETAYGNQIIDCWTTTSRFGVTGQSDENDDDDLEAERWMLA